MPLRDLSNCGNSSTPASLTPSSNIFHLSATILYPVPTLLTAANKVCMYHFDIFDIHSIAMNLYSMCVHFDLFNSAYHRFYFSHMNTTPSSLADFLNLGVNGAQWQNNHINLIKMREITIRHVYNILFLK